MIPTTLRALAALLAALFAHCVTAAPDDLDRSFGVEGKQYVGDTPERPVKQLIQMQDGRLLVLVQGHDQLSDALWRLNADGTPDPSFGNGAGRFDILQTPRRPGFLFSPALIAGPDAMGRVLVGIWEADAGTYFLSVARVLTDGTLDRSFGSDGKASVRVTDDGNFPPAGLVVQPGGRILVVSTSEDFTTDERPVVLARFLDSGQPDAAFGTNGYLRLPFRAEVVGVAQQPDGKLIVAARYPYGPALGTPRTIVARVLPGGQLDSGFADGGLYVDSRGSAVAPLAVSLQPDGKVLIAGSAIAEGGIEQLALLRLLPHGRADLSFGNAGQVVRTVEFGHRSDGSAIAVDSRGRVVVAGTLTPVPATALPFRRIAVARFLPEGTPDLRFAGGGSTSVWANFGAVATGIVIRGGDSILIGGGIDDRPRYFGAGYNVSTPRAALIALEGGDGATVRAHREARAVEYFHAGFGHYFVSATPVEIAALDTYGMYTSDWSRTGRSFRVWAQRASDFAPVCRFFSGDTFAPKSSHFYTPYPAECAALREGAAWAYEGEAFQLRLPAGVVGMRTCPPDTVTLYRAYNNGQGGAPNHRYMADVALLDEMIANGWSMEGEAATRAFACLPVQ